MPNPEYSPITLSTLKAGALEELFQAALQTVMTNIHDINTPAESKRAIVIEIVFKADEERRQVDVGMSVKPKLVSIRGTGTVVFTEDRKDKGKFPVIESNYRQSRIGDAIAAANTEHAPDAPAQQ